MTVKARSLPLQAGLFLVSLAVLHLEILQTRIFSVMLWHHVTYLVVTFTLLGFAAAGAYVAVRPSLLAGDLSPKLARSTFLFGITTVAAFSVLSAVRLDTVDLLENRMQYFLLFLYYIYLVVPYFFGGLAIILLLSGLAEKVNRLYFVNLAGSGAGCLFFLPVLRSAGGAGSVFVVAFTAFLGGLCFALTGRRRVVPVLSALILAGVAAAAFPFADTILPFRPAPSKAMSVFMRESGAVVEETRWDPLCRVDVVLNPTTGERSIFQDGDAPSKIIQWEEGAAIPVNHYSLGYLVQRRDPGPRVLIIGVGGGLDLRQALFFHASSITGAEINPSIARLMREEYDQLTGHVYTREGVRVEVVEGRSFLRRSRDTYDLIQMTGTDTYSALSSGSFVFSESYLYTREAFEDYLDHLSENGVVAVLRFRFFPPRECLRLVSIGAAAMKRKGIEEPGRHILVVSYHRPARNEEGQEVPFAYAVMLFKKSPFTEREIARYQAVCRRPAMMGRYTLTYAPGRGGEEAFQGLLEAVDRGREDRFYEAYPYNVRPVTDDRPFFFAYHKWRSAFDRITSPDYRGVIGQDPVGLYILVTLLLEITVLVALLVWLPLAVFRRRGLRTAGWARVIFFFFALGVSYLFLEIGSMQKFVLFLGHPTYSLSVVLFTFLLFSGLGSLFSRRFNERPYAGIGLAVLGISVFILLYLLLLPHVFHLGLRLPESARMGLTVLLLAPVAFLMGMPFPLGIQEVNRRAPALVPWAFGINGGASVLSSVVSIVLAMSSGFSTVFLLAGLLYLLGWFLFLRFPVARG